MHETPSHSEFIHKRTQVWREGFKKLQTEDKDWSKELFKSWGLRGWVLSTVETRLLILKAFIVEFLLVPCLFVLFL